MKTFQHILFPVDFSGRSESIRPHVAAWAARFHAKVTVFHSIQVPMSMYGNPDALPLPIDYQALEDAGNQRLQKFGFEGAETVVRIGDPGFEVADYAEHNGVDLIMLPTHGYGKFRSLLMGSVAAKVLHDASCAVWTDTHSETPSEHKEIRNILCAIEVGTESSELMETAESFGAQVQLFHFGKAGHPGQEVRDAALLFDADLIIAGRTKVDISSIVHESPCPVLSLK